MLSEEALETLPEVMALRMEELNSFVLQVLGGRIKRIGKLLPSDIHKLNQLEMYTSDMELIAEELAKVTAKNVKEIWSILDTVAEDTVDGCSEYFIRSGTPRKIVPYSENNAVKRIVKAIAKQTQDEYINMSQTSAIGFAKKDENGIMQAVSFEKAYTDMIDKAVTAVATGVSDYNSEIRSILKQLADSGIRDVKYQSGRTRRLDTAVRQNVLWGAKQVSVGIQEQIAEEVGADGWEVSYHKFPRPGHAVMGGKQFAIGKGRKVKGKFYPSFEKWAEPLLNEYNCYHRKYPIILGISVPSYKPDELAALKAKDREEIEFEGEKYTGYEATQIQRKLERAVRNAKYRHIAASAAGDMEMVADEQERLTILNKKYKQFSDAVGFSYKTERLTVEGYRRKTKAELLTVSKKGSKITSKDEYAIKKYISANSYSINAKLREKVTLSRDEKQFIKELDAALEKMPKYEGVVYRSVSSSMINDINKFNNEHKIGNIITYLAYTSSSAEREYDSTMDIQFIIKCKNGYDLRNYNSKEREILLERNSNFIVTSKKENIIYMEEL